MWERDAMENEKKITILTQNNLDYLLSNSVKSLPDNPTSAGYTAARIKEKQWLPSKILFEYLASFQGNVSEAFVEAYTNLTSLDERILEEASARAQEDASLSERIEYAKANGFAKFDDEGRIIKDTYLMKRDLKIAQMVKSGDINPVSSDAVYAYLDDRGVTDVEIMGIADWEE